MYLCAAIGSSDFVKSYMSDKVKEWCDEISQVGLHMQLILPSPMGFWRDGFFIQSVAWYIGELFFPLEQIIRAYLLPALSGKYVFSDVKRQLFSFPLCVGGLDITDPCVSSAFQFDASQRVTGPLVSLLLEQDSQFTIEILNEQLALKQEIHLENRRRSEELTASLHPLLSTEL